MRVGVNGAFLGPRYTGIRTYTSGLLQELAPRLGEVFVYTSFAEALPFPGLQWRETSPLCQADRGSIGNLARLCWTQSVLRRRLKSDRCEILLSPLAEGVLYSEIPQIVVIHDLIPLFYGDECPRLGMYFRQVLPSLFKQKIIIVADSHHTRQDILRHYPVREDQTAVIYPGLDPVYFSSEPGTAPRSHRDRKYFLFVGTYADRKNLTTVFRAYAKIQDQVPEDLYLVAPQPQLSDSLQQLASSLGLESRIQIHTRVPSKELLFLYRNATALVFLSEYEGFGYPALEAMATGTPAIVSGSTSLGEIVGDAALKMEALDVEGAAAAMLEMSTQPAKRAALSELGKVRAREFKWEESAVKFREVIQRLA